MKKIHIPNMAVTKPAAAVAKAAPAPPAPAAPVQAAARAFSATNGKWTIGGLNKHDVYKLVLKDGM